MDFRDRDAWIPFASVDNENMTAVAGERLTCYCEEDGKECACPVVCGDVVPMVWEVCGFCDGRGKYVNPNVDRNGISGDEFREDPEFYESYVNGAYDIQCKQCKGRRVMPQPADPKAREHINKLQVEHDKCMAEMYAEMEAERRMGC